MLLIPVVDVHVIKQLPLPNLNRNVGGNQLEGYLPSLMGLDNLELL